MLIEAFTGRFLKANTYIAACDHTGRALLIDPGLKLNNVRAFVKQKNLSITAIVNTHTHLDHVIGNHKAKKLFGAPVMVHSAERDWIKRVSIGAWLTGHYRVSPPADKILDHGDSIEAGSLSFEVIHTPGHSPGGICLRYKKNIFTGDTLFKGSIGRADLKGGDYNTLVSSIKEKLFILSDDIYCYPGHGPRTTIGDQRMYNIHVRMSPDQIEKLTLALMEETLRRKSKKIKEEKT